MKNQEKKVDLHERNDGRGPLPHVKEADSEWDKKTVARYRDPVHHHLRAVLEEPARFREREKTRPIRTSALWKELLNFLTIKVSDFNAEWGDEFIRCKRGRDKFSISLAPSAPCPPFDAQEEQVQAFVRYDRKLLVIRMVHSEDPHPTFVFALRPDLGSSGDTVEICIVVDKKEVLPYMTMTRECAAESIVECLLRL